MWTTLVHQSNDERKIDDRPIFWWKWALDPVKTDELCWSTEVGEVCWMQSAILFNTKNDKVRERAENAEKGQVEDHRAFWTLFTRQLVILSLIVSGGVLTVIATVRKTVIDVLWPPKD